ncbi:hypothetical protein ACKKBF_B10265 [Auxenochlorella protothecoides x Auxenochlorella symbiontica]
MHGQDLSTCSPALFRPASLATRRPFPAPPTERCRRLRGRAAGQVRGPGPDDDDDEQASLPSSSSVDIDDLVSKLSAHAGRMRAGAPAEPQGGQGTGRQRAISNMGFLLTPAGDEAHITESSIRASVGPGGFHASDFELLQELGQISIQQVETSPGGEEPQQHALHHNTARSVAVIGYTAAYRSGMPFEDPVMVMLKEYLPAARAVAFNELQVLRALTGLPHAHEKFRAASSSLSANPPVVELLGYFLAGHSDSARRLEPAAILAHPENTIWVVTKWDGLAPLTHYPAQQQTSGLGLGRRWGEGAGASHTRKRMLRAIARGLLRALCYCHVRGVVHGSLGSGSVLLSSFDDTHAERLVVKLDNLGFARRVFCPLPDGAGTAGSFEDMLDTQAGLADSPLRQGMAADLQSAALVLLEAVLGGLSAAGPGAGTQGDALRRVLGTVYRYDLSLFRQYCEHEPDWGEATAFLAEGEGAGWHLLGEMLSGEVLTSTLLAHPFCRV